jgi:hypothetical protein
MRATRISIFSIITVTSILLIANILNAQTRPVLFFSDLTSGPKTGWEGSATKGAAVTIWGLNFGAASASSKVTCGGADITSTDSTCIAEWNVSGTGNGIARGLSRTTFYLNSSMADGAGTISVTTTEGTSNTLPFTIRSGNIYFVNVSVGSNSNTGRYSGSGHGSDGPWLTLDQINHNNSSVVPGAVIYVKGGTYSTPARDYSGAFMYFSAAGDGGTSANPIAIAAFPTETVTANCSGRALALRNDSGGANGAIDYWTFSKIKCVNGSYAITMRGTGVRVIGCWFNNFNTDIWAGVVDMDIGSYNYVYGNYFYHCGNSAYMHNVYINGTLGAINHVYIAWNEFDSPVNSGSHGGVIDLRVTSYVYVHDNYCHNGPDEFIYITNEGGTTTYSFIYNNLITNMSGIESCLFLADMDYGSVVYNNTIYHCPSSPSYPVFSVTPVFTSNSHATLKNNIIYGVSGQSTLYKEGSATYNSDYDVYYNTSVPSGSGVTVSHQVTSNPLFITDGSDFHLQSGSPAINAGTNAVSSIVTTDYDGTSRPQGSTYDIGAYEYYTGTQPPPGPPEAPTGLYIVD